MQPIQTTHFGRERKEPSPSRSTRASRLAPRASLLAPRAAFTLTELLVVITIIAILASLVTAAAVTAMRRAKQARILLEIQQISQAIQTFESDKGVYPPNLMHDGTNQIANRVGADLQKTLKKLFPRHQEPPQLIAALAGQLNSGKPNELPGGLNAAEAVYFWMGGFSDDPKYPISGPGGPSFSLNSDHGEIVEDRNRIYEFDLTRLGPRNDNGRFDEAGAGRYIEYQVNMGNSNDNRRINFWTYRPGGSEQPLVYFDVSRYKPYEYDMHASADPANVVEIHAIEKLREGISAATTAEDLVYVNQGKFQMLHSGLDDDWGQEQFAALSLLESGNYADVITYPEGPFVGALADTLTNFTTGTLEQAQE